MNLSVCLEADRGELRRQNIVGTWELDPAVLLFLQLIINHIVHKDDSGSTELCTLRGILLKLLSVRVCF